MNVFQSVSFPRRSRNVFNLSHERLTTLNFGQLIPVLCEEVIPGDTWQVDTELMARAMPMEFPLMHRVNLYVHFFFVPNRLLWDEWEDFITGGEDGNAEPIFPKAPVHHNANISPAGSLSDHFGCGVFYPPQESEIYSGSICSTLPLRAYRLIWNEYYRDQNLQDELEVLKTSGQTNEWMLYNTPLLVDWEKDYFTSALPWTQRGGEAAMPTASQVVEYDHETTNFALYRRPYFDDNVSNTDPLVNNLYNVGIGENDEWSQVQKGVMYGTNGPNGELINAVNYDPNGTLRTMTPIDEQISINEIRRAVAVQTWLEANARGGARYIEQMYAHFGVKSSDARLQLPEFLGGGKMPLRISEVIQTSETTESSALGDLAGHGLAVGSSARFRRYFEEHGLIIGLMFIRPKSMYMQGTRRFLTKFDKFDFYFPEFAHLGEQEIWRSEIDSRFGTGIQSGTFGYQERYAEYKYIPSTVHGEFKTTLLNWHLGRFFHTPPVLNGEFLDVDSTEENLGRIFPVVDGSSAQFLVQLRHNIKAVRKMPKHVIPGL